MANLVLEAHGGGYLLRTVKKFASEEDRDSKYWVPARPMSMFVQRDVEFPCMAALLGFVPCTECRDTDGTVDCDHHTAIDMIVAASDFLSKHVGIISGKKYPYAYEEVLENGTWA